MKKPSIRTCRRLLQITVALTFIAVPLLNRRQINVLSGNFLHFDAAGLPLADPLAVLQVALKSWHLPTDLLLGAGIALAIAVCLGTVFCSWVCPFGLLSEWAHELAARILPNQYRGLVTGNGGFSYKTALFALGLLGFVCLSDAPVLNQLSMPAWYSRVFQVLFLQSYVSLAVLLLVGILVIEFAARNRLWCRYVCPQSLLLILFKVGNPLRLRVGWEQARCICNSSSSPCQKACSLAINPKDLSHTLETECTNCGDCVVACKKMGRALSFRMKAH